jgi:hypothetical protein
VYPNPASDEVNIKFELPATSDMEILLLDEMGRLVRVISKGKRLKGEYTEQVQVAGLSAGLYYVSLRAGEMRETKSLVISK